MKRSTFTFQLVEFIPQKLDEGVLYVSMTYATASHRCFCGCGKKVVTPISPTDWQLIFDGDTLSLDPSIGNWSYPCRSHYVLHANRVRWAGAMSASEIREVRARDAVDKQRYYGRRHRVGPATPTRPNEAPTAPLERLAEERSIWRRILDWWSGIRA